MSVREKTLKSYLASLILNSRIQKFIEVNTSKNASNFHPTLVVVDQVSRSNPSQCAGAAIGAGRVQISQWICIDKDQAFSTVRHELAHCIQYFCNLTGLEHGRGFTQALKAVSPRLWRTDRHWEKTPAVEDARREINQRVWSNIEDRKYYIQVDNGSKFAWRQMTFADIVKVFKKNPKKLWTNGVHCTRIHINFNCSSCKLVFRPVTPGFTTAGYNNSAVAESYFMCPECQNPTKGNVNLLGKDSWSGTLKAWTK